MTEERTIQKRKAILYARGSAEASRNSKDLLEDAKVLYRAGKYARAYALGVLSAEEYAKAFIYKGFSRGWVKEDQIELFRNSLTSHKAKIGAFRILASMTYALFSNPQNWPTIESGKLPERSKWNSQKAERIWKLFEHSERLKEKAFYVEVRGKSFDTPKMAITWQMSRDILNFMTEVTSQYDIQHQEFSSTTFKPERGTSPSGTSKDSTRERTKK